MIYELESSSSFSLLSKEGDSVFAARLNITAGIGNPCDLNGDDVCDAADIDSLTQATLSADSDPKFDFDMNGVLDENDRKILVEDSMNTYFGDSNLDQEFNSSDFVAVFSEAKYETGEMAGWAAGDWDGDFLFSSSDFVVAFSARGYELGPRPEVAAVPEPSCSTLIVIGVGIALTAMWKRMRRGTP